MDPFHSHLEALFATLGSPWRNVANGIQMAA